MSQRLPWHCLVYVFLGNPKLLPRSCLLWCLVRVQRYRLGLGKKKTVRFFYRGTIYW